MALDHATRSRLRALREKLVKAEEAEKKKQQDEGLKWRYMTADEDREQYGPIENLS